MLSYLPLCEKNTQTWSERKKGQYTSQIEEFSSILGKPDCMVTLEEGNGTPLQYSCLENPMDGGAWWAAVHGVARVRHD